MSRCNSLDELVWGQFRLNQALDDGAVDQCRCQRAL